MKDIIPQRQRIEDNRNTILETSTLMYGHRTNEKLELEKAPKQLSLYTDHSRRFRRQMSSGSGNEGKAEALV